MRARRQSFAEKDRDPEQRYANEFAAALLMPKPIVERFASEGLHPAAMSVVFNVPAEAVVYRLKMLGLWNPSEQEGARE